VEDFISRNDLSVKYVFESKPGKSNALNTGIENSKGDIVAFSDDDCYPSPDFLSAIWSAFEDLSVSYTVGRVMLHDPADYPIAVNESMIPVTYRGRSFLSAGLGFFGGGNMAFRRNVLVGIGGFDPMFGPGSRFRYAEDLDVIGRASARGYEGRYYPEIVVRHHHQRKKSDTPALWKACGIGVGAYHMKLLLTYREYWWFMKSLALLFGLHLRIMRRMSLWEPVGAAQYAYWWLFVTRS
jgi:cellulose synthase/poly-beta-1,6-N-acetylglucosamine synthase-like glycosyltransferase